MIEARFGKIRVISPKLFDLLLEDRGVPGIQSIFGILRSTLCLRKSPNIVFIERILPIHRYKRVEKLAQLFPHLEIEDTYRA